MPKSDLLADLAQLEADSNRLFVEGIEVFLIQLDEYAVRERGYLNGESQKVARYGVVPLAKLRWDVHKAAVLWAERLETLNFNAVPLRQFAANIKHAHIVKALDMVPDIEAGMQTAVSRLTQRVRRARHSADAVQVEAEQTHEVVAPVDTPAETTDATQWADISFRPTGRCPAPDAPVDVQVKVADSDWRVISMEYLGLRKGNGRHKEAQVLLFMRLLQNDGKFRTNKHTASRLRQALKSAYPKIKGNPLEYKGEICRATFKVMEPPRAREVPTCSIDDDSNNYLIQDLVDKEIAADYGRQRWNATCSEAD